MSDARQLIAEGIARLFAREVDRDVLEAFDAGDYPGPLWDRVEENGYHRALDDDGTPSATWIDVQPVLRAIGYHRAPVPLAETLVANWLLAHAGLAIAEGPATLVDGTALDAQLAGETVALRGTAAAVPWGRHARRFVIVTALGGRWWAGALDRDDAGELAVGEHRNIAGEPRDDITFAGCRVALQPLPEALGDAPLKTYGALARAVAMSGAAESVLDQALEYANVREQFGRPIGKFQAVQHQLAEAASEVVAADAAVSAGCEAAGQPNAWIEIAAAKCRAGEAALRVARVAHQVHGAMGFTHEHTLHYGTRRLWSWRNEYGNDAWWARLLGAAAIAAGGRSLWPELTGDVATSTWRRPAGDVTRSR